MSNYKFDLGGSFVFYSGCTLGDALSGFIKDRPDRVAEIIDITTPEEVAARRKIAAMLERKRHRHLYAVLAIALLLALPLLLRYYFLWAAYWLK